VAEVDGLSGEVRAIGTFVPGGSIAVNPAKAVVDMNRK
jgi:hypothetical protein